MNVFYEEDGAWKTGSVLTTEPGTLQVESASGKRSKIKAAQVLLEFKQPAHAELLPKAQAEAQGLDVPFLWEAAGLLDGEFGFEELAREYFGHPPSAVESVAILLGLHGAPTYFHRKGRGRYKAATPEQLKAAQLNEERKQKREAQIADLAARLSRSELPAEIATKMPGLLYRPEPNSIEAKALERASELTKLTVPRLLERCGALKSSHAYHFGRFLFEHFPKGREFAAVPAMDEPGGLPRADVAAFSIDDSTTTEIDDAFSVTRLPDGSYRVGIHIAAPALGFLPDTPLDQLARQRLSTVYLPGDKITMLPEPVIKRFSLDAGRVCPAVSLYLTIAGDGSYRVLSEDSRVEEVPIQTNLRYPLIDDQMSEAALQEGTLDFPHGPELRVLWEVATRLEAQRGKLDPFDRTDFLFYVEGTGEDERVRIVPRRRGAPADKVVSELMIYVNSAWGKLLGDRDVRGLFRGQDDGKVRMSLYPSPHRGLGVAQYLWSSSPLRRYCDLVNQWQILSVIYGETPPFAGREQDLLAAMRDFESAHSIYDEFQRAMERYYCLRWLLQEESHVEPAVVVRDSLVRFERIPLYQRVPSLPELPPGRSVQIEVSRIDLYDLTVHCEYKKA